MIDFVGLANELFLDFSLLNAWAQIKPLTLFVAGVVVYSIFIFKFYRFIAKKDIFKIKFVKYKETGSEGVKKFFSFVFYMIRYVFLFPMLLFFWFLVLSVLLAFLTKSNSVEAILLTSMALVAAVRVTAYYNEDLSKDLAKMLPFALLGVFLIDVTYFSLDSSLILVKQIPSLWKTLFHYFIFVVVLEFILRIFAFMLGGLVNKERIKEEEEAEQPPQSESE